MQHSDSVTSLAFSPDGRWLASGGFDECLRIWDPVTGALLRTLEERSEREDATSVHSIVFHPSGALLAYVGGWHGEVIVRETDRWKEMFTEADLPESTQIRFSPDGSILALGAYDESVYLWDVWGQADLESVNLFSRPSALAFAPEGAMLAVGTYDAAIRLLQVPTARTLTSLYGHPDRIDAVAFSSQGNRFVSAAAYGEIRLWDTASWTPLKLLQDRLFCGWTATLAPDGTVLAWGDHEGHIRLSDVNGQTEQPSWLAHRGSVNCLCFSPEGTRLASGGGTDHAVRVWDTNSFSQVA